MTAQKHSTAKPRGQVEEHIRYSFVPNHRETMQALARASFTNQEFRVLIALMNQTNGYLREEVDMSSSFWQALTFMNRQSIHATLKRLVALGTVAMDPGGYSVTHPNAWAPELFKPQQITRRSVSIAMSVLENEKAQHDYRWLKNLLKPSLTRDGLNARATSGKGKPSLTRDGSESVSNQRRTVSNQRRSPSPTTDDLNGPSPSPTPTPIENSTIENVNKKVPSRGPRKKRGSTDSIVTAIFQAMREFLITPDSIMTDPIPSYGKEGQAIKRMLTRGFTREDILACWKGKVSQRGGEFVSMVWVNEDIGRKESHGLRQPGRHPERTNGPRVIVSHEGNGPADEG